MSLSFEKCYSTYIHTRTRISEQVVEIGINDVSSNYHTEVLFITQWVRFIWKRSNISESMNDTKKCFRQKLHDIEYDILVDRFKDVRKLQPCVSYRYESDDHEKHLYNFCVKHFFVSFAFFQIFDRFQISRTLCVRIKHV